MNFDEIMLSEISQSRKTSVQGCTIPLSFMQGTWSSQISGDRKKVEGWWPVTEGRRNGELFNGYRVSVLQDEESG